MQHIYKKGDKVKILQSRIDRFIGQVAVITELSGRGGGIPITFEGNPELLAIIQRENNGGSIWTTPADYVEPATPYTTNVLGDFPKRS